MFKKVYVEITNICNLKCSFCALNKRTKTFLSLDDFRILLNKLSGYTEYLYFHVMGEPLMHPDINIMVDLAYKMYFKVNITTNGYLIKKVENNKNIRQINISLHSYDEHGGVALDDYLENIFNVVDKLTKYGTYVKYRLWVNCAYKSKILDKLCDKYNVKIQEKNMKLSDNIYFEEESQFIWPSLNNDYYNEIGSCRGLRDHIGILVDGTIVPCCLDNEGNIKLGNIYKNTIDDIINSDLFVSMKNGFLNNKKVNELCRHCNFYDSRRKS